MVSQPVKIFQLRLLQRNLQGLWRVTRRPETRRGDAWPAFCNGSALIAVPGEAICSLTSTGSFSLASATSYRPFCCGVEDPSRARFTLSAPKTCNLPCPILKTLFPKKKQDGKAALIRAQALSASFALFLEALGWDIRGRALRATWHKQHPGLLERQNSAQAA